MKRIIIGSRGSKLALWQSEYLAVELKKLIPELEIEIKIIKTKGDKILDVALSKIGDKGLFTKEIEIQLLAGNIDLAAHSMKDLPSEIEKGLLIGAVLKREDPRDVLISHKNYRFQDLPPGAFIGTSSLRRMAQVKATRPDICIRDIRGNVETRIRKMKEEDLDGIILAYAGVKRLGLEDEISDYLPTDIMMPAVGQGVIAVEAREDDQDVLSLLNRINDSSVQFSTMAERSFLNELQGGCQVPVASVAELQGDRIVLQGLVASLDGTEVFRGNCEGSRDEAEKMGRQLARQLMKKGADRVLDAIVNS